MAEIDLTPTEEMAANAARGLELRRKHGKGGTEIGVARARDISNRKNLSPETVRRMHAFFSRHEKNKAGGEDDAGYIAWLLWGGDSGQSWAKRKVEQMNKGENERSDTYKEIAQRLGSAAKMARPVVVDTWNAGHAVVTAELMPDHVGPSGVMPGAMWTGAITAKDRNGSIDRIAFTNPYKNMENAKRALMAEIAKIKASDMWRPRSKNDRPGAKAKFAADAREVGNEILRQLGGGRFMSMVGGKNAMYGMFGGKPGLQVSIGKGAEGGINRVIVTLDPATDTYRMEFWKIAKGGMSTQKVSEASMVYADDLQRVFTDRTRFYTSMSRPGAKAKMQNAQWMQHVSNMLRDLTNERQRVQVWIAGPTTIKVAGMWMAYTRYGKGAAIASRMAYYLTQAAGTPGKYSGQDIKDSPRKGTNTTIWTVSNVPEDAVSYLKAWGIGTSPKAFAGYTGESAVAYARPGAKARMSKDWQTIERYLEVLDTEFGEPRGKAAAQEMMRAAAAIGGDEGARLKAAINTMATSRDYNARQRAYNAIASMMPFSRPGAKAKMGANEDRKRAAGYKWQVRYTKQLGKTDYLGGSPQVIEDTVYFATESNARDWANTMLGKGWFKGMGGSPEKVLTAKVLMFSRPGTKAKFGNADALLSLADGYVSDGNDEAGLLLTDLVKMRNRGLLSPDQSKQLNKLIREAQAMGVFSRPGAKAKMASAKTKQEAREIANNLTIEFQIPAWAEDGVVYVDSTNFNRAVEARKKQSSQGYNSKIKVVATPMSRPGAKVANAIREGEKVSASDDAVSRKIRKLMDEGKPQKQAVAIALDLERRGEL